MYWIVRFLQKLVRALNSDGTPGQVAAGITLGAAVGLTPLASLHNVVFVVLIFLLNVSIPGAFLGWVFFGGAAFALDPVFDQVGTALLFSEGELQGVWATIYNTPVLAFTNLTNSVVLGSLVGWLVLAVPIYFGARWAIGQYREKVYARYKDAKAFQAVRASKLYNFYRLFRP